MREANKLLLVYSREFGLVYLSAQSIRALGSKMRFHAHILSLVDLDMVQGRDIWKLTGIHENISSLKFIGTSWYKLCSNVSRVIMRLCKGEEPNLALWNDMAVLYEYAQQHPESSAVNEKFLEIILVVRILYHLGYWQGDDEITKAPDIFSPTLSTYTETNRFRLIKGIHDAFRESQL